MNDEVLKNAVDQVTLLPEDDFAFLSNCATRRQLKRGETLLEQGDICRSFFLVESGHLTQTIF